MTPIKYDQCFDDTVLLKHIVWDESDYIVTHEYKQISPNLRLYYHGNVEEQRFNFCLVNFCSATGNFHDVWDDPDVEVEIECTGNAFFDGIRHLNIPYWHYANCVDGIKLFQTLLELQEHFNIEDA